MQEDNFDFIAIGDTVTDAFIRLLRASIHHDGDGHIEEICLVNGSKIPFEFAKVIPAVGNSANAAVSAARLGLKAALVTDVGGDQYGQEDIETLRHNGVETRFVRIHEGHSSNYHYVLWYRDERTILIKHEEYAYALPDIGNPKWLYFSSVGENSLEYHKQIAEYLMTHPEVKLAFQPGTFQIRLGYETLKDIYSHSEVFFCNTDEARIILKNQEQDGGKLAQNIAALGPKIAVITDGPRGAYTHDSRTGDTFFMPPYPDPAPPYERTGAGDSFSSTFTAALALGKNIEEALFWAPVNSMSVVQKIGAQEGLLTQDGIRDWLAKAPEEYRVRKI